MTLDRTEREAFENAIGVINRLWNEGGKRYAMATTQAKWTAWQDACAYQRERDAEIAENAKLQASFISLSDKFDAYQEDAEAKLDTLQAENAKLREELSNQNMAYKDSLDWYSALKFEFDKLKIEISSLKSDNLSLVEKLTTEGAKVEGLQRELSAIEGEQEPVAWKVVHHVAPFSDRTVAYLTFHGEDISACQERGDEVSPLYLHPAVNEWKEHVLDKLIVCGIYQKEHDRNPKKALADAIQWNVDVALDPLVSAEAQALRDFVPADMVLVPRSVTEAMMRAGADALLGEISWTEAKSVYRAIITAAEEK